MKKDIGKPTSERRAFIIIENAGLVVGEEKTELSHQEILQAIGISKRRAEQIIKNSPRGYYKDESLIFYQGNFQPLTEENIKLARKYTNDFIKLFGINPDIKIFRSGKQKAIATSWKPLQKSED